MRCNAARAGPHAPWRPRNDGDGAISADIGPVIGCASRRDRFTRGGRRSKRPWRCWQRTVSCYRCRPNAPPARLSSTASNASATRAAAPSETGPPRPYGVRDTRDVSLTCCPRRGPLLWMQHPAPERASPKAKGSVKEYCQQHRCISLPAARSRRHGDDATPSRFAARPYPCFAHHAAGRAASLRPPLSSRHLLATASGL